MPRSSVSNPALSRLERLEAESIHIMRGVAASFANPVMLYSIDKDSSVMLHIAMKAFYPSRPPFPLLHHARTSERQGRLIDSDEQASMEKKKREGYF